MNSDKVGLARRVIATLTEGGSVSFYDALRLRNWADRPEDGLLPLAEIAYGIVSQGEAQLASAAEA